MLARVSTSGLHLPDELKARVLNTFLTLMNLRESLDRAALRMVPGRTVLRSPCRTESPMRQGSASRESAPRMARGCP
jgi:hypothetical protein